MTQWSIFDWCFYFFLVIVLLHVPAQDPTMDPQFYIRKFEEEFNTSTDIPIEIKKYNNYEEENRTVGLCYYSKDRRITIDEKFWNESDRVRKEVVVYHELGHCHFDLRHDNSVFAFDETIGKSLMNSQVSNVYYGYTLFRDLYIADMKRKIAKRENK